jgi:glyoxylase-like metal-dependent hydrolase (beta-lactamase superfamily II)
VLPESELPAKQPDAPVPSRKLPRPVFETIFAFAPNRDTMGGTAYIVLEETGNILMDCPALDDDELQFLQQQGGVRWLFITHRGGIGKVRELYQQFGCEVVIQEQEAYLLPGQKVTTFQAEFLLSPTSVAVWTPGHSPGSSCLHHSRYGGVLFSGRHLLPNAQGVPVPLRIAKTFHWPRQLRSVGQLRDRFSAETLTAICPGANTGFLRGDRYIVRAYEQLQTLDLEALLLQKPGL